MTRITAITPGATPGRARTSRSKSGSRPRARMRRSRMTKPVRASAQAANDGHTQDGQPASRPKVSGSTSASSATDSAAAPARSSRRGGPGGTAGSPRRAPSSSTAPTGALSSSAGRQAAWTIWAPTTSPPITWPAATPTVRIDESIVAIACPASRMTRARIRRGSRGRGVRSWTFVFVCDHRLVVTAHNVFRRDGVRLDDVACRHGRGRGRLEATREIHGIVFVRRGCFVRSADGAEDVVDPTAAYYMNPGVEERFDHPHTEGDDCTALLLDRDVVASLWGGEPGFPSGPVRTAPDVDLEHRLLLAAARRGADPDELFERAVLLAARTLEHADARRVASGRPATGRARGLLADGAREALADDADRTLPELARELAVSPPHLR